MIKYTLVFVCALAVLIFYVWRGHIDPLDQRVFEFDLPTTTSTVFKVFRYADCGFITTVSYESEIGFTSSGEPNFSGQPGEAQYLRVVVTKGSPKRCGEPRPILATQVIEIHPTQAPSRHVRLEIGPGVSDPFTSDSWQLKLIENA